MDASLCPRNTYQVLSSSTLSLVSSHGLTTPVPCPHIVPLSLPSLPKSIRFPKCLPVLLSVCETLSSTLSPPCVATAVFNLCVLSPLPVHGGPVLALVPLLFLVLGIHNRNGHHLLFYPTFMSHLRFPSCWAPQNPIDHASSLAPLAFPLQPGQLDICHPLTCCLGCHYTYSGPLTLCPVHTPYSSDHRCPSESHVLFYMSHARQWNPPDKEGSFRAL